MGMIFYVTCLQKLQPCVVATEIYISLACYSHLQLYTTRATLVLMLHSLERLEALIFHENGTSMKTLWHSLVYHI